MMTIEEKAKAYDEAIERAKMLDSPFYADAAKIIFPEIEDSPDEKTRKFIIECIKELRKSNANTPEFNANCSDAIAWLEKHKEESKCFGYCIKSNCTGCANYDNEKGHDICKVFEDNDSCVSPCCAKLIEMPKEHQPAEWSEEDEEHIESLLERLDGMCKKDATFTPTRFAVSEDMDWLKSLPERLNLQPKQEWSEEDEKILHSIENIIYENVHRIGIVDKNKYVIWLERFRPSIVPEEKAKENAHSFDWPKLTNCKRNCKTCFAKCFYRKENNPDMMGEEKHTIGYLQPKKEEETPIIPLTQSPAEKWDSHRIGVELCGLMESLGLPSDNLPDVYYKIAEHFFNLSKCLTMDEVIEWINKWADNYVNGEFNEFHREFEYDGTVDKARMIAAIQKYINEK